MKQRPSIAVLSTTANMTRKVRALTEKSGRNYSIYEVTFLNVAEVAADLIQNDVKVFISRGHTTRQLRKHFSIPVVNIDHTFHDCFSSYQQARAISPRVAFAAASADFMKVLRKHRSFLQDAALYQFDLTCGDPHILSEIRKVRDKDGIEVFIGGYILEPYVKILGMHYVMSDADEDQILAAFEAAEHFLSIEKDLHEKAHELRNRLEIINSILNCTSDGVLRIDHNRVISNINTIARKLIENDALGNNIEKYFPSPRFAEVIQSGSPVSDELLSYRDDTLVVNISPTIVHGTVTGAVVTLQRQTQIEKMELKIRSKYLDKGHVSDKTFANILGESDSITAAKSLAAKYANVNSTVLVLGRTGTGKELFAQSIHNASRRRHSPFVAINCAAFPPGILESELFGYVKGAFTGAMSEGRPGIFELAHCGTIFLDEISEAPLDVQLKLLRVIQERKVVRIGDDKVTPVDVRIIAASNRDLRKMVEEGLFREDFYYRICVLELIVPSLSERREDIPILVRHFLQNEAFSHCGITESALRLLCEADWPGNIRQLGNIVERLAVTCENGLIDESTIRRSGGLLKRAASQDAYGPAKEGASQDSLLYERRATVEAEYIREVLEKNGGNRELAAMQLGVSVSTLFRRMRQIRLRDPDFFRLIKYGINAR